MLGWPDRVSWESATFSGGTWDSTPYSVSNLRESDTSLVARTTAKTLAATQVIVDLKSARTIRVICETQESP